MGAGVAGICLLAWLTALSVYDIRERRLPNWLTMPGAAVILVTAAVHARGQSALLGALALFAMYALVHMISPTAMGAGDVKLAIGIGALTASFGRDVWLVAALGAPLISAGWATVAVWRRSKQTVPHGLSMCVAAATTAALILPSNYCIPVVG
jgi:leader peptidase (prepilin peptidase)/N-methyltransferase